MECRSEWAGPFPDHCVGHVRSHLVAHQGHGTGTTAIQGSRTRSVAVALGLNGEVRRMARPGLILTAVFLLGAAPGVAEPMPPLPPPRPSDAPGPVPVPPAALSQSSPKETGPPQGLAEPDRCL